jgi:hypothetical protein
LLSNKFFLVALPAGVQQMGAAQVSHQLVSGLAADEGKAPGVMRIISEAAAKASGLTPQQHQALAEDVQASAGYSLGMMMHISR